MSLMKIAHAGLRKALQVFGDKQTKPKQTIKSSLSASRIDFSNILARKHNCHVQSTQQGKGNLLPIINSVTQ